LSLTREEPTCMTNERRDFGRFGTALKAYYMINGEIGEMKHDCTITNMSRKGFGLQVKSDKKINEGAGIQLEIYVPEKKSPTHVQGTVQWIEKKGYFWAVGVECLNIIDELEFSKMS
jgi:hypothetical protein